MELPARAVEDAKAAYFAERAGAVGRPVRRWGRVLAIRWEASTVVYGLDPDHVGAVDRVVAWADDVAPHFDLWPDAATAPVRDALAALDFRPVASQAYLWRGARTVDGPAGARWIRPDEFESWTDVYARAYEFRFDDDERGRYRRDLARQYDGPKWHLCVAEAARRAIAAGALWGGETIGYLTNAATLPEARCRGAHAALIALRARRATELGCRWLASDSSSSSCSQSGETRGWRR